MKHFTLFTKRFSGQRISRFTFLRNLTWTALVLLGGGYFVQPADARVIGSGHVTTETRKVKGFHAVEVLDAGYLVITQGDIEGLTIEAEDNLLPFIRSDVDAEGVLHLGFKTPGDVRTAKTTLFRLSAKMLDRLELAGSGSIQADSLSLGSNGKLIVRLPGSGEIVVNKLIAGELEATLNGCGKIKLGGEVNKQSVSIPGMGNYEAPNLKARSAEILISGYGTCKIWASDDLKITITGNGEVSYYGKPNVNKSVGHSGIVQSLGGRDRSAAERAIP